MKRNFTRFLTVLLAVTLCLSLVITGCGSSNNGGQDKAADSSGQQEEKKDSGKSDSGSKSDVEITLAVVNNPDLNLLEKLSSNYTEKTGVKLNFAIIPENDLRQKLTTHAATGGGQYDIVQIGTYEASFWGKNGWIEDLEPYFESMTEEEREWYDRDDLIKPIRTALSYNGHQYALPFYGESSMMYYNKEIFEQKGLKMPENPTWTDIYELAKQAHDPDNGIYGIAMRGQPGWGMNGAVFGSMIHAFGARWFDENWVPQFNTPEMRRAWEMYKKILTEAGQPDITTYGYNECLQLMLEGKAAMFYDATIFAGVLEGKDSKVRGKIGYAPAPSDKKKNTGWLWAWAFAIDANSSKKQEAFDYLAWASSKDYHKLVAEEEGWQRAPAGCRASTYQNPEYQKQAPFAEIVLNAINRAEYENPAVDPVPYVGIQYVGIPEFADFGTKVMEYLAEYTTGKITLDEALQKSQEVCDRAVKDGGYQK